MTINHYLVDVVLFGIVSDSLRRTTDFCFGGQSNAVLVSHPLHIGYERCHHVVAFFIVAFQFGFDDLWSSITDLSRIDDMKDCNFSIRAFRQYIFSLVVHSGSTAQ